MVKSKALKVPDSMQAIYDEVTTISDGFCKQYLNEEYAELARQMAAALARKRPSPLLSGHIRSWTAGIIYVLGQVNFLFDKSQSPYMRADELCNRMGVSKQTAGGHAKKISDILGTYQLDPNWCLPSKLDNNPLAWTLSVNGLMVDIRRMPREVQEIAFEKGLIPYIPADRE